MSPTPTSHRRGKTLAATLLLLTAVAAAGCQTETRRVGATQQPQRAGVAEVPPSNAANFDPCAVRMHDVAGALLLYYFTYQRLPETLDEVNAFPGADAPVALTCPTSGKPYVYTTSGILLVEQSARVVVYDPTPAHYGGYRWAIRIEDPSVDKPMVARVIALPESFFVLRPPAGASTPADAGPQSTPSR